jgi:hypothetical protein
LKQIGKQEKQQPAPKAPEAPAPEAPSTKNDVILQAPTPDLNPRNRVLGEIAQRANSAADESAAETLPEGDGESMPQDPAPVAAAPSEPEAAPEAEEPAEPQAAAPAAEPAAAPQIAGIDPNAEYEVQVDGSSSAPPSRRQRPSGRYAPSGQAPSRSKGCSRSWRSNCRASWTRNSLSAKGSLRPERVRRHLQRSRPAAAILHKENAARQAGDKRTHVELYKAIGDDLRKKLNRPAWRRRLLPNRLQRRRSRRSRRRKPRLLQRHVLPRRASRAERRLSSRRRARKSLRR